MIKCPDSLLGSTADMPTTYAPTTMDVPTTTTSVTQQPARTTLSVTTNGRYMTETSSMKVHVHSTGGFDNGGSSPTFSPSDDNNWTWPDTETSTDGAFETVDDLQITGNFSVSSEVTVVEPYVSSNYDWTAENLTIDSAVLDSAATEPVATSSTADEPIANSAEESTQEPTASLEIETISNTTDESTNDECNDCTITLGHRTDNLSSQETRKKRMSEIIIDGTRCFQVVCLPRPPSSFNVTDASPTGFQGFGERSSKYQNVYYVVLYTVRSDVIRGRKE